jgi:CheY-like chemotaxis protein
MSVSLGIVLFATDGEDARIAELRRSGYHVATATTIEDALRQLETIPELPRVIVLEIPLRRAGDIDALRRLRTNKYSAQIPVVRLHNENTLELPADTFAALLPASITAPELLDAIARVTQSSSR